MSRPLRIEYPNAYYHVMNRGRGRKSIFHNQDYFNAFLQTLSEAHGRFGLEVHAYCLMPSHFHLLLKTPEGNLQRAMRHIGGVFTQRYNRLRKTDGPLFRGRYKAILVDADNYLLHLSRYIHRNPLEARLVRALEEYPWSSYGQYIGISSCQPWLCRNEVYSQLNVRRLYRKKYQEFVVGGETHEDIDVFYGYKRIKPILGGEDFIRMLASEYGDLTNETDAQDSVIFRPSMERILAAVSDVYKVDLSVLLKSAKGRGSKNTARKVAMYIAQERGGYRLSEIAEVFGLCHYGGVSYAVHDVRTELESDKTLRKKVNSIINKIDL